MISILGESYTILLALLAAITAGLIGAFALMRRMTLAGDAISHIALPGLAIAILFHIDPIIGGAGALIIGSLLIWYVEKNSGLASETAVGVIFSASLALGALLLEGDELIEALFGGHAPITLQEFLIYLAIAAIILLFLLMFRHQLVLSIFSQDLARSSGININRLNLFYLLAFSATIVIGLRFLGALLVGSLIIIPAAASRQLTHHLQTFLFTSALIGALSVLVGFFVSKFYNLPFGPTTITIATLFFVASLLKEKW